MEIILKKLSTGMMTIAACLMIMIGAINIPRILQYENVKSSEYFLIFILAVITVIGFVILFKKIKRKRN